MNVEIRTEAAQFPEKEYMNFPLQCMYCTDSGLTPSPLLADAQTGSIHTIEAIQKYNVQCTTYPNHTTFPAGGDISPMCAPP
jgi:hypothetical protein